MKNQWTAAIAVAALSAASSAALAQNVTTVIANASKAMGVDDLTSINYYGGGANYTLGQNNNANNSWPLVPLNSYRRTIDFAALSSLATATTLAVPVTGGNAVQNTFTQNITAANPAWAQQLEIWVTPWGFLKGAAANQPKLTRQTIGPVRYNIVTWNAPIKAPSGVNYKLVGYIGPDNLVARVDTWLENPIFGDMLVQNAYTEYRDSNGLKFPTTIVQMRGGFPTSYVQVLGVDKNPANLAALLTPPPPPASAPTPPAAGAAPPPPPAATSEKMADGVFRITGGYVALAVEMKDHIVLFEPAGQNEARAQAVFAEVKRVIPGKPIKYGVLSHHHFDHTSGLPAVVAEGITIVTHENNKKFFENALSAPRTLAPDSMSKSGKKPVIETMKDKRVFTDGTRTFEILEVKGLPHADGMLIGYLPKENIVIFADMFNLPGPNGPAVPNPPVVGTQVFVANLERFGIKDAKIVSVHAPNPDRPIMQSDILTTLGR